MDTFENRDESFEGEAAMQTPVDLSQQLRQLGVATLQFAERIGNDGEPSQQQHQAYENHSNANRSYTQSATGSSEQLLATLTSLFNVVRSLIPEEYNEQLKETIKELLGALRSLIDRILQQLNSPAAKQFEMEEIPIT